MKYGNMYYRNKDSSELDFYSTHKDSINTFLQEFLKEHEIKNAWECAVGKGNIAKVLEKYNINVFSSDIVNRGYKDTVEKNFLEFDSLINSNIDTIITNPPYCINNDFMKKSIELNPSKYIILYLKITFFEGKKRYKFFEKYKPYRIYVHPSRQSCNFLGLEKFENKNSSVCYSWWVWKTDDYSQNPTVHWLPINS